MPQSPARMNEQSDRARMHRLAAPAEALEREQRRAARIDVHGAELARQRPDHSPRPAVEGVGQAVHRLRRALEIRPLQTTGEPQKDDGACADARQRRSELAGRGVKPAADCKAERLGAST